MISYQPIAPRAARILIVDDQPATIVLLQSILARAGYPNVRGETDPRQAALVFQTFQPDLVLLDLHMPNVDGFQVLDQLRVLVPEDTYLPILMLTADITAETKRRALAAGAKDFLTKPFDTVEATLRIRNLLESRVLHRTLQLQNQNLEEMVRLRTRALQRSEAEALRHLALAAEYRDDDTHTHTERVGRIAGRLAHEIGLDPAQADLIERAAPLHDVGKLGIPDAILLKPGKLTPDEFARMQTHTTLGSQIFATSEFPIWQLAEVIARTHHERWDGRGYPSGLRREEIPLAGRIVAVVDVFDALIHDRPYKLAWPVEQALEELRNQRGRQFDPTVVEGFLRLCQRGGLPG